MFVPSAMYLTDAHLMRTQWRRDTQPHSRGDMLEPELHGDRQAGTRPGKTCYGSAGTSAAHGATGLGNGAGMSDFQRSVSNAMKPQF